MEFIIELVLELFVEFIFGMADAYINRLNLKKKATKSLQKTRIKIAIITFLVPLLFLFILGFWCPSPINIICFIGALLLTIIFIAVCKKIKEF